MPRKSKGPGSGKPNKMKGKSQSSLGPLREIVGYEEKKPHETSLVTLTYEVLECGHKVLPKKDIYGETIATKRRCKYCLREEQERLRIEAENTTLRVVEE